MVGRHELKPADHIYTPCSGGLYYHHGIYVGKAKVINPDNDAEQQEIDDAVIHLLGFDKKGKRMKRTGSDQCNTCFYMPHHFGVVITCLDCFLGDNSLYIREHGFCSEPDKVIQIAFDILDKKHDFGEYDLVFNNCEHFATYCKTGFGWSEQVVCTCHIL